MGSFFKNIGSKLTIVGMALIGAAVFVLKLISVGKAAKEAEILRLQDEIENESNKALKDAQKHSKLELQQNRDNIDAGNFSDFNAD